MLASGYLESAGVHSFHRVFFTNLNLPTHPLYDDTQEESEILFSLFSR